MLRKVTGIGNTRNVSVSARRRSALSSLLPKLRFADANASDELHQLQRELVSDELVVRKNSGGR